MRTEVKKWGNSAALRLPAKAMARAGLDINSPVEIEATEGKLIVTAIEGPQYTLDQLLAQCSPNKMTLSEEDRQWLETEPVGREIW